MKITLGTPSVPVWSNLPVAAWDEVGRAELQAQGVLSSEAADKVRAAAIPHKITEHEARQVTRTYDLDAYGD
ncbi:hypothetical protein [Streptomyces longisporus]|uniref:Uncharacterized protein n=1 Tax=Streptomyces longisporus TaxID=1948 RepID=A0ABN3LMZ8_STRLO